MSWRRRVWSTAGLICALACARLGHAQSIDDVELRVTPDARGCITEAALRARLVSLRAKAEGAYGIALVVDASTPPEVLEVRRNDVVIATRRFDELPERCADRLQTVALVIALAIEHAIAPEPEAVEDEPVEPEPEPAEPAAPAVKSAPKPEPPEEEPPVEDDEPDGPEPALRTIVGLGAAYGLLPELAGTLAVGVELPGAAVTLGLGALVTTEASSSLAGGTALTQLAGARGYGCAGGKGLALDLQACAGLALGVVSGAGRDYAHSEDAVGTLFAPLLRLGARYPARGLFSVGLALEGFVLLVRPELQVSGRAGAVSSLPLFGAGLSIEGVLALP